MRAVLDDTRSFAYNSNGSYSMAVATTVPPLDLDAPVVIDRVVLVASVIKGSGVCAPQNNRDNWDGMVPGNWNQNFEKLRAYKKQPAWPLWCTGQNSC